MKSRYLIGVVFLSLLGCAQFANSETSVSLLSSVDISDGVNRTEAQNIAVAYFLKHVGCGGFTGISNNETSWVVEGRHGLAGELIKGFLINKNSGSITSTVGPSYEHPNDMLR